MAVRRTSRRTSVRGSRRTFPRRRTTTRPRRRVSRLRLSRPLPSMPATKKLSKYALSQIDPFDDRVLGVKIPDANSVPSSSLCLQAEYPITTAALQTLAGNMYLPDLNHEVVPATYASASTWTWAADYTTGTSADAKAATVKTSYTALRTVAHGVRLSSSLSINAAKGYVHIAVQPIDIYNSSGWNTASQIPKSLTDLANLSWYRRYPISSLTQRSIVITNKFLDDTSQRYHSAQQGGIGSATSLPQLNNSLQWNWCAIFVFVEGVDAASTPIDVEVILHNEGIPSPGGLVQATAAEPSDPQELDNTGYAASNVSPTHYTDETPGVAQQFVNAMNEASRLSGAVGNIINTVTGNRGRMSISHITHPALNGTGR